MKPNLQSVRTLLMSLFTPQGLRIFLFDFAGSEFLNGLPDNASLEILAFEAVLKLHRDGYLSGEFFLALNSRFPRRRVDINLVADQCGFSDSLLILATIESAYTSLVEGNDIPGFITSLGSSSVVERLFEESTLLVEASPQDGWFVTGRTTFLICSPARGQKAVFTKLVKTLFCLYSFHCPMSDLARELLALRYEADPPMRFGRHRLVDSMVARTKAKMVDHVFVFGGDRGSLDEDSYPLWEEAKTYLKSHFTHPTVQLGSLQTFFTAIVHWKFDGEPGALPKDSKLGAFLGLTTEPGSPR